MSLTSNYAKAQWIYAILFKTKIARSSKEINLLEGVKKNDDNFFSKYKYLEKITLPNTVKYIGPHAFKNCKNLKEINLENVKEIHAGPLKDVED